MKHSNALNTKLLRWPLSKDSFLHDNSLMCLFLFTIQSFCISRAPLLEAQEHVEQGAGGNGFLG